MNDSSQQQPALVIHQPSATEQDGGMDAFTRAVAAIVTRIMLEEQQVTSVQSPRQKEGT